MSDHTDTTLTDTERDSLTECECGHYLNEHSSDGCLANDDDGDLCVCMATPDLIRERAIVAIVAARVAAARAEAWERGAFAGREFQKRLYEYVHPTNISAKQPEMPPNPYRALIEGADQ